MTTKIKLEKSPKGKPLTIFSHSSCGCYALMLESNGQLSFGSRCGNMIKSGFSMSLETDVNVAITYDGVILNFYVDGNLVNT